METPIVDNPTRDHKRLALLAAGFSLAGWLGTGAPVMPIGLSGLLWLIAWALVAHGLAWFRWDRRLYRTVAVGALVLAGLLWQYTGTHPRIRLELSLSEGKPTEKRMADARFMNTGNASTRVSMDARPYHLKADDFKHADELRNYIQGRLAEKNPSSPNDVMVPEGSGRSITFQIGPATDDMPVQLVAGWYGFRDRLIWRKKEFCFYWMPGNPKTWLCPFMSDDD